MFSFALSFYPLTLSCFPLIQFFLSCFGTPSSVAYLLIAHSFLVPPRFDIFFLILFLFFYRKCNFGRIKVSLLISPKEKQCSLFAAGDLFVHVLASMLENDCPSLLCVQAYVGLL